MNLAVMRAIDKLERLGPGGVWALLTAGRLDQSGDFTPGCNLPYEQARDIMIILNAWPEQADAYVQAVWAEAGLV